ncbi:MAG: hypothetical protein E6H92_03020 [Chloroflexi bacterium]|nr:MAG: hypothetical protein E6H92_03020 [Chloroflexota bacterium]
MKQRIALFWGALTLLLVGVVAAIAYHAGQTTTVIATRAGDGTVYYPGYGWGFFPFFGLFPLLLIGILLFAVFRRPWGRGYWGGGGYGRPGGVPPAVDDRLKEWHRQAHGEGSTSGSGTTNTPPSA